MARRRSAHQSVRVTVQSRILMVKELFRQKFPAGTDETVVRATLLQQGFKRPDHPGLACLPRNGDPRPAYDLSKTLEYDWGQFPCGNQVVVWWTASARGAITDVGGYRHLACV